MGGRKTVLPWKHHTRVGASLWCIKEPLDVRATRIGASRAIFKNIIKVLCVLEITDTHAGAELSSVHRKGGHGGAERLIDTTAGKRRTLPRPTPGTSVLVFAP